MIPAPAGGSMGAFMGQSPGAAGMTPGMPMQPEQPDQEAELLQALLGQAQGGALAQMPMIPESLSPLELAMLTGALGGAPGVGGMGGGYAGR